MTTDSTPDHLQEVEPELPVTDLLSEYKPDVEPKQSQSFTSQPADTCT